jgi:Nucleotide-diphospho-sugar transferase
MNAAVEDAILLVVSKGLPDFVCNTLASIARCGAIGTIWVALPRNALAEVTAAVAGRWPIEHLLLDDVSATDFSWINEYQVVYRGVFSRFTVAKWTAIRCLLEHPAGFKRVTYTDVDVAWIRDPLPILRRALERYEIAMQTEGMEGFPPRYCTGFMSFRNSPTTHKMIRYLEQTHRNVVVERQDPRIADQAVFNQVVTDSKGGMQALIFPLSEQLFADGMLAKALTVQHEQIDGMLLRPFKPIIFHANHTLGLENKRRLLKMTGNWLVE